MARTSPGRYALTEFAKNVFDVAIANGKGQPLTAARPNLHQWDVAGHDGTVVVTYKIFGDRTDGTYLGIDSMHAHINIPAALMFARGWFERPARVTFVRPPGKTWKVATQLFPTADPLVFTAPNIHYLMDSPTDFSDFTLRTFTVDDGQKRPGGPPTFRIALTHDGTEAEADAFAKDVERIVREAINMFGELPMFETNTYTFLSVYLPWANGDGMEHRNSTSLTSSGALRNPQQRQGLLGTVSHEFFHAWNMERIRSKGIEPFDFEEADMSDDLWLGEGFTNYFDGLILERAGLMTFDRFIGDLGGIINDVTLSPGRKFRSPIDMSRLAPFVDAAVSVDRTAWQNTFISYYTYGSAVGFGLDLELRARTNGKVTGDDLHAGVVDGVRQARSEGTGEGGHAVHDRWAERDAGQGLGRPRVRQRVLHEVRRRPRPPGLRAAAGARRSRGAQTGRRQGICRPGDLAARWQCAARRRARCRSIRRSTRPAWRKTISSPASMAPSSARSAAYEEALARNKPGATVAIRYIRRNGEVVNTNVTLEEDPRVEIVPIEKTGGTLTDDQRRMRELWLNSPKR